MRNAARRYQGNPLTVYMRRLRVMARDRYFSLHSIDVREVDRNAPNIKIDKTLIIVSF